jgi:hypothetical protein
LNGVSVSKPWSMPKAQHRREHRHNWTVKTEVVRVYPMPVGGGTAQFRDEMWVHSICSTCGKVARSRRVAE